MATLGLLLPAILMLGAPPNQAEKADADLLVDVARLDPKFILDIKYATEDNFFKEKVYPQARCLLRKEVAPKIVRAQRWLDQHHAGLRLMFKDCYRPNHVQRIMWAAVKGTPKARYVANPNTKTGSLHSYGGAIDLTLADQDGKELDMGTQYDHLGVLAEPRHEKKHLASGQLSEAQVHNRSILRKAMKASRMRMIGREWWHFNDAPKKVIRQQYKRLDVPFSAVP